MFHVQDIPALELDECFPYLMRGGSAAAQVTSLLLMWPGNFLTLTSLSKITGLEDPLTVLFCLHDSTAVRPVVQNIAHLSNIQ